MAVEKRKERIMAELYDRISSQFYDYHAKRGDVQFFVGFALESGGPVLELGCGTGRVLIPTARAGVNITGLDKSMEMLELCQEKLNKEPPEVIQKARLVHADMRQFDLKSRFSLVTITFGPFNYLVTVQEQISCLDCIRQHLSDQGTLLFDVYYINLKELTAPPGTDIVSKTTPFTMPDGRSVSWGIRRTRPIDYNRQVMEDGLYYDIRYPDGKQERIIYTDPFRYYYPFEVEHLLARTGFKTEAVYADFDKTPLEPTIPAT